MEIENVFVFLEFIIDDGKRSVASYDAERNSNNQTNISRIEIFYFYFSR
jgi:hypothetical protein